MNLDGDRKYRNRDWATATSWKLVEWLEYWSKWCEMGMSRGDPALYKSDTEARAWMFDFTSLWVDCCDASNSGVEPPSGVWDVTDYVRRNGRDWTSEKLLGWLNEKNAELRKIDDPCGGETAGDGLILVARLVIREIPNCQSWTEVDSFVQGLQNRHHLELHGEVYGIIRNRARSAGSEKVTAMGAAVILFIDALTRGASLASIKAGSDDGLGGTWR